MSALARFWRKLLHMGASGQRPEASVTATTSSLSAELDRTFEEVLPSCPPIDARLLHTILRDLNRSWGAEEIAVGDASSVRNAISLMFERDKGRVGYRDSSYGGVLVEDGKWGYRWQQYKGVTQEMVEALRGATGASMKSVFNDPHLGWYFRGYCMWRLTPSSEVGEAGIALIASHDSPLPPGTTYKEGYHFLPAVSDPVPDG